MRKILLLACSAAFLFASDFSYATKVKSVYLTPTDTKVSGRLLPTNAIKILGSEGDRVKFEIKGFQNPAAPNIIYYSDGDRILSLAFAKTAKPDIKIEKLGEDNK